MPADIAAAMAVTHPAMPTIDEIEAWRMRKLAEMARGGNKRPAPAVYIIAIH
jgi:hypothetical protein